MSDDDHVRGNRPRFGIYTGIVHDSADPEQRGRLRLLIPSVMGTTVHPIWAKCAAGYAGTSRRGAGGAQRRSKGTFRIPDVGSQVLVQFVDGDIEAPIWTPGIWSNDDIPPGIKSAPGTVGYEVYPQKSQLARGESIDVIETSVGDLRITMDDGRDIEIDTEGGNLAVRTDGGGTIALQGGSSAQKAIRATDGIVCGTLGVVLQPMTGIMLGITYTPPPGMGVTVTLNAASVAAGVSTVPLVGKHVGGAPLVLIGGGP